MDIKQRFKTLLKVLRIKNSEIAEELRLTKGSISDITHGRVKKISGPVIELLKIKFNVNPNWLLTGEGEMFLEESESEQKKTDHVIGETAERYRVHDGDVEIFPVDSDNIHHTVWFESLSKVKKWLVAAINDDDMDEDLSKEIKEYLEMRLRVKKELKKDREAKENETPPLKQKGEAG